MKIQIIDTNKGIIKELYLNHQTLETFTSSETKFECEETIELDHIKIYYKYDAPTYHKLLQSLENGIYLTLPCEPIQDNYTKDFITNLNNKYFELNPTKMHLSNFLKTIQNKTDIKEICTMCTEWLNIPWNAIEILPGMVELAGYMSDLIDECEKDGVL